MTFGYLSWRQADGTVVALNDLNDVLVLRGATGLDAPPPVNTTEDYIAFDGAALTNRRRSVRSITLPLSIRHASRVQTRVGQLASMFQSTGQLVFNDGTNNRYLRNVIYQGGLDGDDSANTSRVERRLRVALMALDPWWYGTAQSVSLPIAAATAFDAVTPFDAVIPFDGGASVGATVPGDAEAYPLVTVYGPASAVTIGANGSDWTTAVALGATDVLTVDSRPGNRGPRLNGGAINWALLTAASRLWTLPTGTPSIIVGTAGTTGATAATVSFEPRYATR